MGSAQALSAFEYALSKVERYRLTGGNEPSVERSLRAPVVETTVAGRRSTRGAALRPPVVFP